MVVDFFFAPGSRYSYLASTQIAKLEAETGCRVSWRPVNGPDIRRLRGRDPFEGPALSGQYELAYRRTDAEAWAGMYGVPFYEPREFHFDHALLVEACLAGTMLGAGPDFFRDISGAIYVRRSWPIDEAMVCGVASEHDLDRDAFVEALHSEAVAKARAAAAREAFERGAFGVPTFFVGDEMFWGNDRLPLVRHAVERHAGSGERLEDRPPELATASEHQEVLRALIEREPIFHRPELGTTRADFDAMMEPDFYEVGASGRRYRRDYVLDILEARHSRPHDDIFETRDFHCRKASPNDYLLTYTLVQGARVSRRSTLWRQHGEDWKIVYHQGTLVES